MQFKTWQEFFHTDEHGGWVIQIIRHGKPWSNVIDIEELYQHFKARLMDEVVGKEKIHTDDETFYIIDIPLKNKEDK